MSLSLSRERSLHRLEEKLNLRFKDINLLHQALTHSSYGKKMGVSHNERLEFLGDAVIGFIVSKHLFREYKTWPEGELSRLRARLVNKRALSGLARRIGLSRYLLVDKDQKGIKRQDSVLSNAYEALVGAIFLDRGIEKAESFLLSFLPSQEDLREMEDYKSYLQEYTQVFYRTLPEYEVVEEKGPEHRKLFRVVVKVGDKSLGEGWGRSKKSAEKEAARKALEKVIGEV